MKTFFQRKPLAAAVIVAAFLAVGIAGIATAVGHGNAAAAAPAPSYMSVPF